MWGSGSDTNAAKLLGILRGELGVGVVEQPRRLDGVVLLLGVRRAAGRREHLQLHVGVGHALEALVHDAGLVDAQRPRRQRARGLRQAAPPMRISVSLYAFGE